LLNKNESGLKEEYKKCVKTVKGAFMNVDIDILNFLELMPVSVYVKTIEGIILYCNKAQAVSFGYENANDLIGKKESDVARVKSIDDSYRINDIRVLELKKPCVFEEKIEVNGKRKVLLSSKMPIRDKDNKPFGIFGISIDITKKSEEIESAFLQRDEAFATLESIISHLPGHVYWLDLENNILGCNENQALMLGYVKASDIVNKNISEVLPKDLVEQISVINEEVIKSNTEHCTEEKSTLLDGKERTYLSKRTPLYDNLKKLKGVVGLSIDITELKETKKSLQDSLEKINKISKELENTLQLYKQFVEDQEHDIRTPLGNVASCSEFLLQELSDSTLLNEELRLLLEGVCKSSREILDYQNSLLFDLYEGQLTEETIFTRFDLPEIVKHAYHVNIVSARYKGIDYTYLIDTKIPNYLLGDGKRIYQCLVDLLSNAVRFTHEGGVELVVDCLKHDDRTEIIRFIVKDTGIGIPEEKQADVLKAFVKAKPSNKGGERGRGLGLTRVNQYALEMGGELRFESIEGKGSCFTLVIPLKISLDQSQK